MLCPKCHQDNPAGARFCNACGAALGREAPPADEALHLDLLHRYISKPLADKMRALGGRIEGERRHVTVMFADLSGFTAMSEKLDPEDVTLVMNACFKELVEVVFRYEGTIDKFIGDEIMALFGVPIAHENDPERSVRAALEMQERLRTFNATLKVPLPKPLTMHVGINSGEVIAGNVGSDLRMDYSILGDTVNLAARLVAASQSGQTFVSDRTHALTRHVFDFRRLKPFKVQGKQKRVQVYEVLGAKKTPESGRGVQAGYGPLIDREPEMAVLRGAVEAVRQGQGQVLSLAGETGIGKTRLVYELRQMAKGFTVVSGACTSYEAPPAYQVFTDVMRGLLQVEVDDPEPVVREKMETWAVAHELDAEAVLPYLGSLFAVWDEHLPYLPDEEKFRGLREAVLSVLRAVTAARPLLMALEDLQWIDPSSRWLLDDLVGQAGSLPLLLCCVYRPEFQPEWEGVPGCRTLSVEPLSREHTVALSESIVRLDLPPELEHAITARAEGNPFFVEEMLKALINEGVIVKTRAGYELEKDIAEVRLPATMQGVIMARIDRLEAQARETLQVASVIGRRFSETLLKAVSPRSQHVGRDLEQLQGLELVYQHSLSPDLEYTFKHFVTREVAYNSILTKRRKAIHLEIARAIEKVYRDRIEEHYEALAHHFEAGEDWGKAADYFGRAGTKARELYSDASAVAFLDRRDQAVQKVFEQKEKGSRSRLFLIGLYFLLIVVYSSLFVQAFSRFSLIGVMSIASALCLTVGLIATAKYKGADSVTIYTDRILVRSRREFIQVPFQDITSVQWPRHPGLEVYRLFLDHRMWKARGFLGTFSVGNFFKKLLYFDIVDHTLHISCRSGRPLSLTSQSAGDLYRQVKVSMTKWAVFQRVEIEGVFEGSPSRFEEQYHLPLRQADGASLSSVTYDQLIERIEKGEVDERDEVALRDDLSAKETWMGLGAAGQEDRRLWAALHPVRHGLKAWYHGSTGFITGTVALAVMVMAFSLYLRRWGGVHWGVLFQSVEITALACSFIPGLYLRLGFLEWTKRYALPRWQRIGLRVVTGVAVPAVVIGLF